jgi:RNA polymerase sigma-70 factor (ECF subfamily)
MASRQLRNADDASDAVQETVVKAFRAIPDFDHTRPLRPWLCRICANCCIDLIRQRKRDAEPLDLFENVLTDETTDVSRSATTSVQHEVVTEAIDRLPEHYREIIRMRHFRHMDVTEIADQLDKPEGTVKSWLFRARAMLRKELAPALG